MDNYFDFYDLPMSINLDEQELRNRYLLKSKENHPDFFINDPEKYEQAMERTGLNNKAYQILKNERSRIGHILEIYGLLSGTEKDIPKSFLMQMMDLNEAVMDLQMEENEEGYTAIKEELSGLNQELKEQLDAVSMKFDENTADKDKLEKIREIYLKQKYLLRIKDSLSTFADRFQTE